MQSRASTAPTQRRSAPLHRAALMSLAVALALATTLAVISGCAQNRTEGAVEGWETVQLDDTSYQPAPTLADGSPAPQVMAEVTLPGGAVPSLPQASVPEGLPPSVLRSPAPSEEVPASTSTTTTTVAPPPVNEARALQALGDAASAATAGQALRRIQYDWRTLLPGWQLRFLPGRSGYRGSTFPDSKVIEVYVRAGDTPEELSHVIAHEIGHAVDVTHLDDVERAAWMAARGIDAGVPWFPGSSGAADFATGAGDFAESFAHWQTSVSWYSRLGSPPDVAQTALLARLSLP